MSLGGIRVVLGGTGLSLGGTGVIPASSGRHGVVPVKCLDVPRRHCGDTVRFWEGLAQPWAGTGNLWEALECRQSTGRHCAVLGATGAVLGSSERQRCPCEVLVCRQGALR